MGRINVEISFDEIFGITTSLRANEKALRTESYQYDNSNNNNNYGMEYKCYPKDASESSIAIKLVDNLFFFVGWFPIGIAANSITSTS